MTWTPETIAALAAALVTIITALTTGIVTVVKLFRMGDQLAENTAKTEAVHNQTIATAAKVDTLVDKTI